MIWPSLPRRPLPQKIIITTPSHHISALTPRKTRLTSTQTIKTADNTLHETPQQSHILVAAPALQPPTSEDYCEKLGHLGGTSSSLTRTSPLLSQWRTRPGGGETSANGLCVALCGLLLFDAQKPRRSWLVLGS
jgi:hypothetical protein